MIQEKTSYWFSFFIAFLFIPVSDAQAEFDYFDLAPEQLLNIKVTSVTKTTSSVAQSAAAIYVITNEDIIRSGVTTIPDALRMAPGVNVAQINGNNWAISIRGFNDPLANKLLVMIDGRTIYNPVFGGVFWEAHDLVMEDIERIEVVRGPGGTLWGANAVNGVINIITKHSRDTQGDLISGLYGNEEEGTLTARRGGSFGEDGFYRFYVKGSDRDSTLTPNSDEDAHDEWAGYRAGFRADWDERFVLQGDAYHTESDRQIIAYSLVEFPRVQGQIIQYDGAHLLGRWTDERDDGSQLMVQSYVDWARRTEPYNVIDNRMIFDVEGQYNFAPIGSHEIITGMGYRFAGDEQDNQGNRNAVFTPEDRRDSFYSAFIQDKITLVPDEWYFTLGSKFEYNDYTGFEVQPSGRLQWHPDGDQTLWAAVSRAVRAPTPLEQHFERTGEAAPGAPGVRVAIVGNPDFKSEELTAFEAGYRNQITSEFSTDIAAFYNDYTRLSTLAILPPEIVNNGIDPLHIFIPVHFENNMQGKSYGLEAAASWTVNPDLTISANYSFLHLSLKTDGIPENEAAEDKNPYHQANMHISWNINNNWTLDTSAHYVDQLQADEIDDYLRLDINLGWQINENLRFNLVGQNIIDPKHREFGAENDLNAGEIERSIFGKMTWEF